MARLLLAALLLVLPGCFAQGNPALTDEALLSQIKVGVSTKADVRRLLGSPPYTYTWFTSQGLDNETWAYDYYKPEPNPLVFAPFLGLFAVATGDYGTSESRALSVVFSREGVVQERRSWPSRKN